MQEKIAVFDERGAPSGQTYYRRAKQLVAKGRAAWQDSDKTAIRLTPKENETDKETFIMEFDSIEHSILRENEELMYTAKRNVRLKRNLIWHLAAFLLALPLVFAALPDFLDSTFVTTATATDITLAEAEAAAVILDGLRQLAFTFGQQGGGAASRIVARAAADLVNPGGSTDFLAVQYFAWGAYFAWGLFILTRVALVLELKVKQKEQRQVSAEYRRLMKGALDDSAVDLRENA